MIHEKLNESFNKYLDECTECPFENFDKNWRDEEGCGKLGAHVFPNSDKKVLIVGQNPSYNRYKGNYSFSGHQGDLFREIFGKEHLVFTNFIQVSTPDNKVDYLTDEEIFHCFNHLEKELLTIKPFIIIICSSFAKNKIAKLNLNDRIEKICKNIYYFKHPDYYISYGKGNINEYIEQLKKIKENICFT